MGKGTLIKNGIDYSNGRSGGEGGASSWQDLEDKPFETLSDNFEVEDGVLGIAKDISLVGTPTAPDPDKTDGTATRIATSGYVTRTIADAIKDIASIKFEKVQTLPSEGKTGTIYLVPKTPAGASNIYTEYYWAPKTVDSYEVWYNQDSSTLKHFIVSKDEWNTIASTKDTAGKYYKAIEDSDKSTGYMEINLRWDNSYNTIIFVFAGTHYSWKTPGGTSYPWYREAQIEGGQWEILGDTEINLDNYVTNATLNDNFDKIVGWHQTEMPEYGWICDSKYFSNTTDIILNVGGRTFSKTNTKPAIVCYGKVPSGLYGPLVVSTDPEATEYTTSIGGRFRDMYTVKYLGVTWHAAAYEYYDSGNINGGYGERIDPPATADEGYTIAQQWIINLLKEANVSTGLQEPVQTQIDTVKEEMENISSLKLSTEGHTNENIKFGYEDGKYGYYVERAGADTFFPFSEAEDFTELILLINARTGYDDDNITDAVLHLLAYSAADGFYLNIQKVNEQYSIGFQDPYLEYPHDVISINTNNGFFSFSVNEEITVS